MNRGTNKIEESLLFHSLIVVSEWKFIKMDNLKNEAASEVHHNSYDLENDIDEAEEIKHRVIDIQSSI